MCMWPEKSIWIRENLSVSKNASLIQSWQCKILRFLRQIFPIAEISYFGIIMELLRVLSMCLSVNFNLKSLFSIWQRLHPLLYPVIQVVCDDMYIFLYKCTLWLQDGNTFRSSTIYSLFVFKSPGSKIWYCSKMWYCNPSVQRSGFFRAMIASAVFGVQWWSDGF